MSVDVEPIRIIDAATGASVPAELRYDLSLTDVAGAEAAWGPLRRGTGAQHSHWDWVFKYGLLKRPGTRFLGVVRNGMLEGLAQLREVGYTARLSPEFGFPLVFVEYLEVAPWNFQDIPGHAKFKQVGSHLIRGAILVSLRIGVSGRLGLHALGQAESFYRDKCLMTDLGPDPGYNGMRYFEFTAADSTAFEQRVPK